VSLSIALASSCAELKPEKDDCDELPEWVVFRRLLSRGLEGMA
jgi:hypothetical protein